MPLSPADVHNVAFSKPPIGKRGYNEDEVDQFLDLVEDALAQLQDENEDLQAQVSDLNSQAKAGAGAGAAGLGARDHRELALRLCGHGDVGAAGDRAAGVQARRDRRPAGGLGS